MGQAERRPRAPDSAQRAGERPSLQRLTGRSSQGWDGVALMPCWCACLFTPLGLLEPATGAAPRQQLSPLRCLPPNTRAAFSKHCNWPSRHLTAPPTACPLAPQEFALRYLNKQALACYWLQLLRKYSQLLTYDPSSPGGGAASFEQPLDEALEVLRQQREMQGEGVWPSIEAPGPMRELPAAALQEAPDKSLAVAAWSRWLHDDPALETPKEMAVAAAQLPLGEPGEAAGQQLAAGAMAAGAGDQQPAVDCDDEEQAPEAQRQQPVVAAAQGQQLAAGPAAQEQRLATGPAAQEPAAGEAGQQSASTEHKLRHNRRLQ
jgi:hypothetical protein